MKSKFNKVSYIAATAVLFGLASGPALASQKELASCKVHIHLQYPSGERRVRVTTVHRLDKEVDCTEFAEQSVKPQWTSAAAEVGVRVVKVTGSRRPFWAWGGEPEVETLGTCLMVVAAVQWDKTIVLQSEIVPRQSGEDGCTSATKATIQLWTKSYGVPRGNSGPGFHGLSPALMVPFSSEG
jgi:hypothetical protein